MAIYREKRKHRFTVIDNQPLQDSKLSNKALGLLVRMLSLPDNWKFYEKDLEKRCDKDGREAIHNQMLELQSLGYVTKIRHRSEDGKFAKTDLIVHEQPVPPSTGNPSTVKPSTEKPSTANPQLQNTKSTKYSTNKILNESSSTPPQKSKSIDPFNITVKTKEEEDQKINELIKGFSDKTDSVLLKPQYNQINRLLHQLSLSDATDQVSQVVDSIGPGIRDPVAYLIQSLRNAV